MLVNIEIKESERQYCRSIAEQIKSLLPGQAKVLFDIAEGRSLPPGNGGCYDYNLYHRAGSLEDCLRNEGRGGSLVIPDALIGPVWAAATVFRWAAEQQDADWAGRPHPAFPTSLVPLWGSEGVL